MNQFTFDILLEFFYNKFAITFVFCLFGSFVREYLSNKTTGSNGKKSGNLNPGRMAISAIFSDFLMCAVADYVSIDLHIEVYAIISIVLGIWGMEIIKCILNIKFIKNFSSNIVKSIITSPVLKSAVESASTVLEDEDTNKDKQHSSKDNDAKKEESSEKDKTDNK